MTTENTQNVNTVIAQQQTDAVWNCTNCNSSLTIDHDASSITQYGEFMPIIVYLLLLSPYYSAVLLLILCMYYIRQIYYWWGVGNSVDACTDDNCDQCLPVEIDFQRN